MWFGLESGVATLTTDYPYLFIPGSLNRMLSPNRFLMEHFHTFLPTLLALDD